MNTQDPSLYRLLLDNQSTAIVLLDAQLRLQYMNPAAEMLLAVSGPRSQGQPINELLNDPAQLLQGLQQALASNHAFVHRDAQLQAFDERPITVDYTATPLHDQNQRLLLLELLPKDRLQRISREADQLTQHQTSRQLVRSLAHEVKNPLGGIRGAAQLLERELNDEGLADYTNIIIAEANRLSALVDRMLGSNKQPELTLGNVHEILERVASLLDTESQGNVTLVRDYDPSIPDLPLDRQQMIQALLNIGRNALQAISEAGQHDGRIVLRSRTLRQFNIGRQRHRLVVHLEIIDNGPGIPATLQDTLFYPMVSGRAGGTGLGLSIAQHIIAQHQGLIECHSQPGHTVFSIYLPLPGANAHEPH